MKWTLINNRANIDQMAQTLQIKPLLAKLLVNRNVRTKNTALKFLNPQKKHINHDLLLNMDKGVELLKSYLNTNKKIAVFGDYDVDGVMAAAILYKGLQVLHEDIMYYIPHREKEGYGLNKKAIEYLKAQNTDLIIAVDNGISALEEVDFAKESGMEVLIIDHHEAIIKGGEEILPDCLVINPKQRNCPYPFKELCAAALAYKFISLIHNHNEDEFLAMAAIGTLCDVVSLLGENRTLAAEGLKILNKGIENPGLKALAKEKNIEEITEDTIGFQIGPCINAAGRLKNAEIALELFLAKDETTAKILAKELNALNEERKAKTKAAFDSVEKELEKYKQDKVIVIYKEDIHESIAGIVAGRIKDRLHKPVVILTEGEDCVKGSARSVEGYDIYKELAENRHLFRRFGGHNMAAGMSLDKDNISTLREELNKNFDHHTEPVIFIDELLEVDQVTYALAKEIDILRPFGKDNPPPLFMAEKVPITDLRILDRKNTIIFTLGSKINIKAVFFGDTSKFENLIEENYNFYESEKILKGILRTAKLCLDIVYYIDINHYNGLTSVQLKIEDFRI